MSIGADINCSTSIVGSVLHMACSEKISNRLEVLQLLLERGANPNIIVLGLDGTPMLPPLGDYMTASDEHEPEVIHLMLRYGAEVRNTANMMLLHLSWKTILNRSYKYTSGDYFSYIKSRSNHI